ncbi:MAG: hypothetical protein LBC68_07575 [Prevotellaceae bacterium]|jgi:hypothetical protein|nr:hypothetical protein [Prevotellaceae bacterium]
MTNQNYNQQLNQLFEKWKVASVKNGHDTFCYDGLMFKGEKYSEWNLRSEGNENELWHNAPKRVLFLLKDMNGGEDACEQDVREWYCHTPNENLSALFFKNIGYWLYGLLNVDSNGNAPVFESLSDNAVTDFFDQTPFAYVNCKKQSGNNTIGSEELAEHITLYKDFIKREIEILDPDIIVCGGGQSMLKNFVAENIYNLEKINGWIYFDKKKNKVVIDSYHPSYWQGGGSETIYTPMMSAYKEFLQKYPDFQKSCRNQKSNIKASPAKPKEQDFNLINKYFNMGIFKKNALEIVTKELQAEFGKKLQVKNCEYSDGRKYVQFWFEPYDKWIEVWDGDKLEFWLASKENSSEGFEVGGIAFNSRVWSNELKYHWYSAEGHKEFNPKSEESISALVADAVAVLNDLITYQA